MFNFLKKLFSCGGPCACKSDKPNFAEDTCLMSKEPLISDAPDGYDPEDNGEEVPCDSVALDEESPQSTEAQAVDDHRIDVLSLDSFVYGAGPNKEFDWELRNSFSQAVDNMIDRADRSMQSAKKKIERSEEKLEAAIDAENEVNTQREARISLADAVKGRLLRKYDVIMFNTRKSRRDGILIIHIDAVFSIECDSNEIEMVPMFMESRKPEGDSEPEEDSDGDN